MVCQIGGAHYTAEMEVQGLQVLFYISVIVVGQLASNVAPITVFTRLHPLALLAIATLWGMDLTKVSRNLVPIVEVEVHRQRRS